MGVDEARRDVQAGGVDDPLGGRAREAPDIDDPVALDGDVRPVGWIARAIDDPAAGDQHVEHHAVARARSWLATGCGSGVAA